MLAVVVLLGVAGCARPSSGAGSGPPPMGTNGAAVPALDWRGCGGAFRCADITVPLDYRAPGGETITLAAVRLPATDPGARLGTLAVNYGGPGSPATSSLRRLSQRFAGTYSAATYANLFPARTRAMVLDGSLDLAANAAGAPGTERVPVDVRAGVSEAWEEAFGVALDRCAADGPACPLAATGDPRARATDVVAAAAAGTLGATSAALVERIDRALQTEGRLPGLMRTLAALAPAAPPSGGRVPLPATPWAPQHSPSYLAIQCTDSVTPAAADVDAAVVAEQAAHPIVGATTALNHAMCVDWPAIDPDRYLGPWNAPLAAPALLVNSRYDPTTPLIDARSTASQLSAARVLVVDAIGHTTLDAPSRRAQDAYTAYLLDPTVTPPEHCPAGL